jgi:parallel beta-helix repeat protein
MAWRAKSLVVTPRRRATRRRFFLVPGGRLMVSVSRIAVRHYNTGRPASSAPAGIPGDPPSPGWPRRTSFATLVLLAYLLPLTPCRSDTHYVALTGGHVSPFTNWNDAATDIQSAVDAAEAGDTVLVSNGVYQSGARVTPGGSLSNRVVITNSITVRSVNGPESTIIKGNRPMGSNAVRCVFITNGAALIGFTLTNGATRGSSDANLDRSGGGALAIGGMVSNCLISGNTAGFGGGARGGTLIACDLTGNSSLSGGGAYEATLNGCTLVANTAQLGGGVSDCTLYQCELVGNSSQNGGGSSGGVLSQCNLSGNSSEFGGGSIRGILSNCLLSANTADYGGGSYGGVLFSCALFGNSATFEGGGSSQATQYNCTIAFNTADVGGGTYTGKLHNCIVYYNTANAAPNHENSVMSYSCTTPQAGGVGNITNDPALASLTHLSFDSPCRGAADSSNAFGLDVDGEVWGNPPSMGCDEIRPGAVTGDLQVSISVPFTNVAIGFPLDFTAVISGRTTRSIWAFGDGTFVSNRPVWVHAFSTAATYGVVLKAFNETHPGGIGFTVQVHVAEQVIHHVALNNPSPSAPFTNWIRAATSIQDAVDAATQAGALILVSNGTYETGGRAVYGALTNRLVVTNAVVIRSVNGPSVTAIRGVGPFGSNAVRGAYVGSRASLSGLTFTNGHTLVITLDHDPVREGFGGGLFCEGFPVLSNCVISGNSAHNSGGGIYRGRLYNCTISGNSARFDGGGTYFSTLYDSVITRNVGITGASAGGGSALGSLYGCAISHNTAWEGGGVSEARLYQCTIVSNSAVDSGCGAYRSTLYSCLLSGNQGASSFIWGGGAYGSKLINCTVSGNDAVRGGGMVAGSALNCIVYYNTAETEPNHDATAMSFSCTTPSPVGGAGNIDDEPLFVSEINGDYDLLPDSPCVDAGVNQPWMSELADIANRPRIMNGRVDMGAHEFRFEANLRGFLEGASDSTAGVMRISTALPANSPYAADASVAEAFPSNAVDWVLVQLRPSPTSAPATSVSAILRNDGQVVRPDGGEAVYLEAAGNQHVALFHRNHLAVISDSAVFTSRVAAFDFSTNVLTVLGGTNALTEVEPGKWALIAGDADGDGQILEVDRKIWETQEGQ